MITVGKRDRNHKPEPRTFNGFIVLSDFPQSDFTSADVLSIVILTHAVSFSGFSCSCLLRQWRCLKTANKVCRGAGKFFLSRSLRARSPHAFTFAAAVPRQRTSSERSESRRVRKVVFRERPELSNLPFRQILVLARWNRSGREISCSARPAFAAGPRQY